MATLKAFRGTRFTPEAGLLDDLVAPPYDVLSPDQRNAYAAKSPYNIVHVTLPEQKSDDRSKFIKYARSAALLAEWRKNGVTETEDTPCFYRYRQTFSLGNGLPLLTRTALVTLLKVEDYEKGIVLPHEQTFSKHKEDRLRLLEATRTHTESIFGLYEDENRSIHNLIESSPSLEPVFCHSEEGVDHEFAPISDPTTIQQITEALKYARVWIADGHHRYETAVNFRAAFGEQSNLIPEDFIVIALSSMTDPGLVLLPTHRIVPKLEATGEELLKNLQTVFDLEKTSFEQLQEDLETHPRSIAIILPNEVAFLLKIRDQRKVDALLEGIGSDRLKALDVSLLHQVILAEICKLTNPESVKYTRSIEEAISTVTNGEARCAFVMLPPSVEDMRTLALLGERMPQKSTYYYPKLLSGLVEWSLNDFE